MKTISVVTPCYNEQDNVQICVNVIKDVFSKYDNYKYEHIFIDNASTDSTLEKLREIASLNPAMGPDHIGEVNFVSWPEFFASWESSRSVVRLSVREMGAESATGAACRAQAA